MLFRSVVAIVLPRTEQRRQFRILQAEQLVIRLNPHVDGTFRITKNNLGPLGHVVQVPWGLTLSNTGNQKLSVIKYSITTGSSPNSTFYSGIDGGMVNADGKPVSLPFSIEPGDSRSFVVFIGTTVPSNVYEILSSNGNRDLPTIARAKIALAKRGIDIYGNKVAYQEYAGGGYLLTVDKENQKYPRYWFQVDSGRGNAFLTSGTQYETQRNDGP